jgi:hypothetical protein
MAQHEALKLDAFGRSKSLCPDSHSIRGTAEQGCESGMIIELMNIGAVPNGDIEGRAAMLAGRIESYGNRGCQSGVNRGESGPRCKIHYHVKPFPSQDGNCGRRIFKRTLYPRHL